MQPGPKAIRPKRVAALAKIAGYTQNANAGAAVRSKGLTRHRHLDPLDENIPARRTLVKNRLL